LRKIELKTFHIREYLKISFHTSSLVGLKTSAQKNFGNSSKADLKFLLAVMQTQNLKGCQIFQGRKFKNPQRMFVRIVDL